MLKRLIWEILYNKYSIVYKQASDHSQLQFILLGIANISLPVATTVLSHPAL